MRRLLFSGFLLTLSSSLTLRAETVNTNAPASRTRSEMRTMFDFAFNAAVNAIVAAGQVGVPAMLLMSDARTLAGGAPGVSANGTSITNIDSRTINNFAPTQSGSGGSGGSFDSTTDSVANAAPASALVGGASAGSGAGAGGNSPGLNFSNDVDSGGAAAAGASAQATNLRPTITEIGGSLADFQGSDFAALAADLSPNESESIVSSQALQIAKQGLSSDVVERTFAQNPNEAAMGIQVASSRRDTSRGAGGDGAPRESNAGTAPPLPVIFPIAPANTPAPSPSPSPSAAPTSEKPKPETKPPTNDKVTPPKDSNKKVDPPKKGPGDTGIKQEGECSATAILEKLVKYLEKDGKQITLAYVNDKVAGTCKLMAATGNTLTTVEAQQVPGCKSFSFQISNNLLILTAKEASETLHKTVQEFCKKIDASFKPSVAEPRSSSESPDAEKKPVSVPKEHLPVPLSPTD